MSNPKCPLCGSQTTPFFNDKNGSFHSCPKCSIVFRDPSQLPGRELERSRYRLHENYSGDPGYLKFVLPITDHVLQSFGDGSKGLDFGCGYNPVLADFLRSKGLDIEIYDPIFFPEEGVLTAKYDFITCCEVMEHFHHPEKEFRRLISLLRPGGQLICMTSLYSDSMDFGTWYYKNDPTHVVFYKAQTLEFIRKNTRFTSVKVDGNRIIFTK